MNKRIKLADVFEMAYEKLPISRYSGCCEAIETASRVIANQLGDRGGDVECDIQDEANIFFARHFIPSEHWYRSYWWPTPSSYGRTKEVAEIQMERKIALSLAALIAKDQNLVIDVEIVRNKPKYNYNNYTW